jgi:TetR/AcrR family transcriptional regulator, transcriptional repressor of bet genes
MPDTLTTVKKPRDYADRVARQAPADKFDERRNQLAESALRTLGELGYARTSLREIAHNSEFSHGVVHYYFDDKLDLIVHGVRLYKARCVTRYDEVIANSAAPAELVAAFAAKLAETIRDEAPMHRLWYDLRTQGMFEAGLRDAVVLIDKTLEQMIWRVVRRYSELTGRPPSRTPAAAYGLLDGLFQQALFGWVTERPGALDELVAEVTELMPYLLSPAAS